VDGPPPKSNVPVICVATDAPGSGRQAVVSVDTMVSGSLAADCWENLSKGRESGSNAECDGHSEHAEKATPSKALCVPIPGDAAGGND